MIYYRIPTDEDYWGAETTPKQADTLTDNYVRLCEKFLQINPPDVEVEIKTVSETVSTMNQTHCTLCSQAEGGCPECETIIAALNDLAYKLNFITAYERELDDEEIAALCKTNGGQ